MSSNSIPLTPAEIEFIERMGINAEADGQARITGRIWGLLMVVARMLTSAEIAGTLQVSRGSVSTNLRLLESLEIIERRSKPGEREIYFAMHPNPYNSLIRQFAQRFAKHRRMVEEAAAHMDRQEGRQNLANLARFYGLMEKQHCSLLDDLDDEQ